MIFYTAHGQNGACGPNCSDYRCVVEWDTFKGLFAFMDHLGERRMPMVLHNWGAGNLKVATSLGKIIRDHGLDARAGTTLIADCAEVTETECITLKRSGKVLDAKIDTTFVACDDNCVLVLAGGVHRTLPADATVVIGPTHIADRLAPNASQDRQERVTPAQRMESQERPRPRKPGLTLTLWDESPSGKSRGGTRTDVRIPLTDARPCPLGTA